MVEDYGIEAPVAFYLWRPILAEKVRQHDVDLSIQLRKRKLLEGLAANDKSGDAQFNGADSSTSALNTEMLDISEDLSIPTTIDQTELKEERDGKLTPSNYEE